MQSPLHILLNKIACLSGFHSYLEVVGKIKFLGDVYLVIPCMYCNKAKLELSYENTI